MICILSVIYILYFIVVVTEKNGIWPRQFSTSGVEPVLPITTVLPRSFELTSLPTKSK